MFTFKKLARAKTKAKHAICLGVIRFICRRMDVVSAIQFLKTTGNSVARNIAASNQPEIGKRRAFKRIRRLVRREICLAHKRFSENLLASVAASALRRG